MIGGLAHLVNFFGTDTLPAMRAAKHYYGANYDGLAYSVPATEHSIMTSLGEQGEYDIVKNCLEQYPDKILSIVADSFDYYKFVKTMATEPFKTLILKRALPFVIRPDSVTPEHTTPEDIVIWTVQQLAADWGVTINSKGYKVINAPIRVLYGDGLDEVSIEKILIKLQQYHYSTDNIATFGMGGGLLQKVNRDTQRFAFKSSAQFRDGAWHDVYKKPLDITKASKRGHLKLKRIHGAHSATYITETTTPYDYNGDELVTVFENGEILRRYTFDEVRHNAKL
jgi:nicotinamide phosphoribosyltransferase